MFRSVLAGALLLAGTIGAEAAQRVDLSKASCETPAFKSVILARLGHGRSKATGQLMPTRFDYGPILSAATISHTGNLISCEITVDLAAGGGTRPIHGRFTLKQGDNSTNWDWSPGY